MIFFKNSKLGYGLIKVLDERTGLYGAATENSNSIMISCEYEFICPFEGERAIVKKDGELLEIDIEGMEYFNRTDFGFAPFFVKSDYCPECHGLPVDECKTCIGTGIIPLNFKKGFDWDLGFDDFI